MSRSRAKRSERCIDGLFILLPLSLVHHRDYSRFCHLCLKFSAVAPNVSR